MPLSYLHALRSLILLPLVVIYRLALDMELDKGFSRADKSHSRFHDMLEYLRSSSRRTIEMTV